MKTSCKAFVFLLIIFISSANAKDSKEFYLHPTSSIYAWLKTPFNCISFDGDKEYPFPFYMIYLTFEIPLNLSNSLIIQPSLWYNKSVNKTYILDAHGLVFKLFRLGSGIGLRHFVKEIGKGLYLQAMSSVHYYSVEESYNEDLKGYYADLLGYLGYSWKFSRLSIFFDIGIIGIGTIYPTDNSSDNPSEVITAGYTKPFTVDANLGIGFSF